MRTNIFIQIFVEREYRIQASKRRTSSDLLSCPSFEDRHSDEWSAEATHRTGELHGSTDAWYLKFRTCRATHTLALWSKSEFQWLPIRDHSFDQDGMMIVYSVQLAPGFLEMRACATKVLATPSVTLSKSFRCYGVLCLMKHISWSVHSPYATESESDKYQTHMTCFAWLSEALFLCLQSQKSVNKRHLWPSFEGCDVQSILLSASNEVGKEPQSDHGCLRDYATPEMASFGCRHLHACAPLPWISGSPDTVFWIIMSATP